MPKEITMDTLDDLATAVLNGVRSATNKTLLNEWLTEPTPTLTPIEEA
jgi:hypothetical protein